MILPPLEADELLDAIDANWRDHFSCRAAAEQFYRDELPPPPKLGRVIFSSRYEPSETKPVSDDGVDFDDDLEDRNERN